MAFNVTAPLADILRTMRRDVHAINREIAVQNRLSLEFSRRVTLSWSVTWLVLGSLAGAGSWWFGRCIATMEHDVNALEVGTGTRTLLYSVLANMLGDKIRGSWKLDQLVEALTKQEQKQERDGPYGIAIRARGALGFAEFLMDRALELGVVSTSEWSHQRDGGEYYRIRHGPLDRSGDRPRSAP